MRWGSPLGLTSYSNCNMPKGLTNLEDLWGCIAMTLQGKRVSTKLDAEGCKTHADFAGLS